MEEEAEDYVQVLAQNIDPIDDEGADAEQEQHKGDQYKAKSGKLWQKTISSTAAVKSKIL